MSETLDQLHEDHQTWLRELDLWQDEIRYFQNRLAEISARMKDDSMDQKIHEYKERFIKFLVKIDLHRHIIHAHDRQVGERMELVNRMKREVGSTGEHHAEKEEIGDLEKRYKELKGEFLEFLENAKKNVK